jgi:hypothetical protein
MLNFFKRKPGPQPEAKPARPARPRPPAAAGRSALPAEPAPLPEVTEGNLETDWAMWEDSVAFQDSQMPSSFNALDSVRTRESEPAPLDKADPFSAVRKRGS